MTFKTCATSALIAVAVLGATACKKDDSTDGGSGGARGFESEVDDLKDQIKALQDLLDEEVGDVESIESALATAQERLDALLTCGNGGECDAQAEISTALTDVTDAYCDYVFGCCSAEDVVGALGVTFQDADACKAVYSDVLNRGRFQSIYGEGGLVSAAPASDFGSVVENILRYSGTLNSIVEGGSLTLDPTQVAACVTEVESFSCADPDANSCGAQESACSNLFTGQQALGEPCRTDLECGEGVVCDRGVGSDSLDYLLFSVDRGYGLGNCIPEAEVDDPCRDDSDCQDDANSLFCQEAEQTCQAKVAAGEACAYIDPNIGSGELEADCVDGYSCSLKTNTCVADCDQDAVCYAFNSSCGEGFTCNIRDDRDDLGLLGLEGQSISAAGLNGPGLYFGFCDAPAVKGDIVEQSSECESGKAWQDPQRANNQVCKSEAGDLCDDNQECVSNLCFDDKCAPATFVDFSGESIDRGYEYGYDASLSYGEGGYGDYFSSSTTCGEDSYSVKTGGSVFGQGFRGACLEAEASEVGGPCYQNDDRGCTDSYCDSGTCVVFKARDAACDGFTDTACAPEDFCDYGEGFGAATGTAYGYGCKERDSGLTPCGSDSGTFNANASRDNCGVGLSCVSTDDDGDICLEPDGRSGGQYCNGYSDCASKRCDDNKCIAPSLEEGDTCSTVDFGDSIGFDPCVDGLYCKPNSSVSSDSSGVCTAQVAQGDLCDEMTRDILGENFQQCESNTRCVQRGRESFSVGYRVSEYVCPILQENAQNACIFRIDYAMLSDYQGNEDNGSSSPQAALN
jgi:hypothetical protein